MNSTVDISIVVLIAASMVLVALLLCLVERRSRTPDPDLDSATAWLIAANCALLVSCITLLFHFSLPFWLSAGTIVGGAYLGILCGFFAMQRGLRVRPRYRLFAVISAGILAVQSVVVALANLPALFVSASVFNGLMTLAMGLIILRLSRPHERELRLLVSLPFFVLSAGYTLRLILLASGAPREVLLTTTALTAFALSYSALQWCFGLIALRAAGLNMSLRLERQRAQDLAEARARFLAHMSHEIRTPLNSVIGMADVLQGVVREKEARDLVGHIQHSGDLLIRILNDILDVSKLQANAVTLEQRPFQIDDLLRQITASHGPKCRERGLALEVDVQPDAVGYWLGDPHRVDQILQNVVGNAVKFTEAGHVRVTVSGADRLTLVVEDTGIGMTGAQVASMFEEFSQADEGITRRFGGTGLGMSIVHRLVTVMGGGITAESQPGKGTRFTITLPLQRVVPDAPVADAGPVPVADFAALRVLCADDSKGNLMVLSAMLRQLGVEPQAADDGHAAIRIAGQQAFDLYLLDISMPGFSGIETLHQLRQMEQERGRAPAYAVAATANALAPDLALYLASGFDAHLPKPIRLEALRSILLACGRDRMAA
ncbi:MAG: ATP-binding protein [Paracoccaceae bacterium]